MSHFLISPFSSLGGHKDMMVHQPYLLTGTPSALSAETMLSL